ncbi:unnamed protein product [Diamesa serratosioi]
MPPPFWMHCNVCAIQYSSAKKFYMMSCQHTLCRDCMKLTENGKKCPLDKKDIKFEEVTKLQEKQRRFFQPKILSVLNEPMKMINFQQKQQKHYVNLIKSFKKKYQKASQMKAIMEKEAFQLNAELKRLIDRRVLMQQKLKQIYIKRTQKNSYREPFESNLTGTTSTTRSTPSTSSVASNSTIGSGLVGSFFNSHAPNFHSSDTPKK